MRQPGVVEANVPQDRPLQILVAAKAVALKNVLDPTIEPLDDSVRLRPHWWGQAVLDGKLSAEPVELVGTGCGAAAQAEQAVGELFAVMRSVPAEC